MNLWDFKRFRLNDLALAYVYKSQGTLAKPASKAGGSSVAIWGLTSAGRREVGEEGGPGTGLLLLLAGPGSELI